jgi:hypothetical protein
MKAPTTNGKNLLPGVYEIDAEGIVLYSSLKSEDGSILRAYDLDGLDFFRRVTQFRNARDLQHRFDLFRQANVTTEAFEFTCQYEAEQQTIRILLARLTKGQEPGSFIIYVRPQYRAQM